MRDYRNSKILVLSIAMFGLLLSPAVLAVCDEHAEAAAADETKSCCAKKAQQAEAEMKDCCKEAGGRENCEKCNEYAAVAASAKSGCSKSAAKLIALAKESDCPEGAALAAKAEQGDKEALAALISGCNGSAKAHHAVAQGHHAVEGHHTAETAMLAAHARNGCSKSAAQLVALAKESGCPKGEALAAKVEAGDEEAKAELIAMFAEEDAAAKE